MTTITWKQWRWIITGMITSTNVPQLQQWYDMTRIWWLNMHLKSDSLIKHMARLERKKMPVWKLLRSVFQFLLLPFLPSPWKLNPLHQFPCSKPITSWQLPHNKTTSLKQVSAGKSPMCLLHCVVSQIPLQRLATSSSTGKLRETCVTDFDHLPWMDYLLQDPTCPNPWMDPTQVYCYDAYYNNH